MKFNFKLIKKISETSGISGFEKEIRKLVIEEVKDYCDKVSIDNLGNVVAFKKGGESKKVMIAAHMDEIGFIVNHIDENGFIRFLPVGGFDPKTLTSLRVILHGKKDIVGVMGCKPIHLMSADEKNRPLKTSDFYIETGLTKKQLDKIIEIGTPISRERELIDFGSCINGKSLDNRVSVFVLIETLKELKKAELPYDLYAVFTVQEEVGIRGAKVATLEIQPDFGFAIDTTIAFDVPGSSPHENITKLGDGVAIKIMDASVITDYRMVEYMKNIANEYKIKWQPELMHVGGTDTANIQQMTKSGAITGAISIPTRNLHQVVETANKEDILSAIDLLKNSILNLNNFNWSF